MVAAYHYHSGDCRQLAAGTQRYAPQRARESGLCVENYRSIRCQSSQPGVSDLYWQYPGNLAFPTSSQHSGNSCRSEIEWYMAHGLALVGGMHGPSANPRCVVAPGCDWSVHMV